MVDLNIKNEKELYSALGLYSKSQSDWENAIPQIAELLNYPSIRIKAKALWLLGEMGYKYPIIIKPFVNQIVDMLQDKDDKIRERAVGALGRIGRGDIKIIQTHIDKIIEMANDKVPAVRMNFVWASENIAVNNPTLFEHTMEIFSNLLEDEALRVRREAPEIFRVIGKRIPNLVKPYINKLKYISENDLDRVVKIHSLGAIKATIVEIE